jgi:S-DNA-T family DNA segregation ATPase FtsK/SpoIIIE
METEPSSEARLRHQLGVQSRQINRVLSSHQVPASVAGGEVRPKVVSFDIQTQIAAGLERIRGLKGDLISALGVGDVALSRDDGQWRLQVARPEDPPVPLLRLLASIPDLPPKTAAIGLAESGQPVTARFSADGIGHILIAGEPNAGKTNLLRTIAVSLALTNRQSDLQLQVMNPQLFDGDQGSLRSNPLLPLGYLPHMLTDPAWGPEACESIIHFLAEEMAYRRRERAHNPRIIVLMDHAMTYLEHSAPAARDDFLRLLQYGAQAGIHLVMATDRPDSPLIDSTIKTSLSVRVIGRLSDAGIARKIAGVKLDQAPLLYGEGDFLAVDSDGVTYFQAAYIGDYDLHMKLAELFDQPRPRLLAQPYSARPRVAKKKAKATPQSFSIRDGSIDLDEEGETGDA